MQRIMMKSKIHRATVTGADLNYVGSITLDPRLMELADIREHEQVHVLDIDNGARFETYAIPGGPGDVCLNGAAARLVQPGDRVIVITYADYDDAEVAARLADEFPDGVWFFELASVTDPTAIPDAVAAVLGITQQPGKTVSESVAADLRTSLDLFLEENLAYAGRLAAAGVPVELRVFPGAFHGFDLIPGVGISAQARLASQESMRSIVVA